MRDFFVNNLNLTLEVELIKKKLINHEITSFLAMKHWIGFFISGLN